MTSTLTTTTSGTDLMTLLAQATSSAATSTSGSSGEFASQLLSAQTNGAPQLAAQPAAGDSLPTQSASAQPTTADADPTPAPGLPSTSGSLATITASAVSLAAPPADDTPGPKMPTPSATPVPLAPTASSSSVSTGDQGIPVVSAALPAPADTTTPTTPGRHSVAHRSSSSDGSTQPLPLLATVPSPVPVAPGATVNATAALDTEMDDAADDTTAAATSSTSLTAIGGDATPRPVAARGHVSATPVAAPSAWLDAVGKADATVAAPTSPVMGDQPRSSGDDTKQSADDPSATASIDATGATSAAPVAAPMVATTVPAPAAAAATAPPLADQLARPIFTLRSAAPGEHVMTIRVAPEAIGPVTVRAHISGSDIRVQVIAPNDESTAALNAILPDLKRDLAQGGMNAALTLHQHTSGDLASGTGASSDQRTPSQSSAASDFGGRGSREQQHTAASAPTTATTASAPTSPSPTRSTDASLDVLA